MDKYENMGGVPDPQNLRFFTWWVLLAQVFGLTAVILTAVWMGHFRGGFAWQSDPGKEFNYHPLFMVIGMIFLYGNAILVYRVFRNDRKVYVKVLHGSLLLFSLLFAAVGLKAVFDSHNLNDPPLSNLYSLHSWLGLTCIILFSCQWLCGLSCFLWPGLSINLRAFYKPHHVFWGIVIFGLAIATALTGITEKAIFLLNQINYSGHSLEGTVLNVLGLVLVALGFTVGYIVTNGNFARQPLPEEEVIPLTQ